MPKGTLATVASLGGSTIQKTITKEADNTVVHGDGSSSISLPVATLLLTFVNDGDDTASGTLTAGHGLETGTFDLWWATGVRYGVAFTVSTNDWTMTDSGAGDALPASSTVCNISEQVLINTAIDGDAVVLIVMNSSLRTSVACHDVDDDVIEAIELLADEPYHWHDTNGITNPFAGDPITYLAVSNGETSAAAILQVLVLQDSTP